MGLAGAGVARGRPGRDGADSCDHWALGAGRGPRVRYTNQDKVLFAQGTCQ